MKKYIVVIAISVICSVVCNTAFNIHANKVAEAEKEVYRKITPTLAERGIYSFEVTGSEADVMYVSKRARISGNEFSVCAIDQEGKERQLAVFYPRNNPTHAIVTDKVSRERL